ncbi:beta-lactamase/transpeptidase-like protein [Mycena floridula]|nr:beta-lactamase/transpeptidase-like protein [Mycena floridula]
MLAFLSIFIAAALVHGTSALQACPVLGSSFPVPKALSTSSTIQSAASNLTNAIQSAISAGITSHGALESNNTSFSIGIFTTKSPDFLFEYHHSAPSLANSTSGLKSGIDADSVYRLGSMSKLMAVYTFLIEAGDLQWSDPITKYIPELKAAADATPADSLDAVSWNDVTIGALASHQAGVGRDYLLGDIFTGDSTPDLAFGLPPLNISDRTLCVLPVQCNRADLLKGLAGRRPVLAPFTTATYSNVAFQLLGYALESITNKTFQSSVEDSFFKPLNMTSSSYTIPADESRGVIPVSIAASWWGVEIGDEAPAGGFFSSTCDVAKAGRAILESSLISPLLTRRWMKPHSHTSSFSMSLGAPWEIRRLVLPDENRIIDIYTKSGDLGSYSTLIGLLPDYEVGFSILAAGTAPHLDATTLAGLIGDAFLPSLETAAREEADVNFAGLYTSSIVNSTIVLNTESGKPGFGISRWISNGTDMAQTLATFLHGQTSPRLYPTNLLSKSSYYFRALFEQPPAVIDNGPFSFDCTSSSFFMLDSVHYGTIALDDFVFDLDGDGKATSLEARALRLALERA